MRQRTGPEPTLVCLPGFQGDARVFAEFASRWQRRVLLVDLPTGSPREAGAVLSSRLSRWIDGEVDWLTGSFGGLVLRSLPDRWVGRAVLVGTLDTHARVPRKAFAARHLVNRLPGALLEVLYRTHLRRSLRSDGVSADLVERMTRRGLTAEVVRGRLDGVLEWEVDPPLRVPPTTLREPGVHRPWASDPAGFAELLQGVLA